MRTCIRFLCSFDYVRDYLAASLYGNCYQLDEPFFYWSEFTFRTIFSDISETAVLVFVTPIDRKEYIHIMISIGIDVGKFKHCAAVIDDKTGERIFDFEIVSYGANTRKGTGTVTIKGIGEVGGMRTVKFSIGAQELSGIVLRSPAGTLTY